MIIQTVYLLDLLVSGDRSLYITLLLEPGADGLEGAISAAPAIVIHMILHVVVVAVDAPNQEHLEKTHTWLPILEQYVSASIFKRGTTVWQRLLWLLPIPFHCPGRGV